MNIFLRQKKVLFIIGALAVVVLLVAIVWASVYLLRRSAGDTSPIPLFGTLPGSELIQRITGNDSPAATPTPTSQLIQVTPTPTPSPTAPVAKNIDLTITFTRGESPPFKISSAGYTSDDPNLADADPRDGNRFSILHVINTNNQVVAEYPIMVATAEILENKIGAGLNFYTSSQTRIILPAASTSLARIELRSADNTLLDSRSLSGVQTFLQQFRTRIAGLARLLNHKRHEVFAQEEPEEDPCQAIAPIVDPETGERRTLSHFVIGITNEGTVKSEEEVRTILERIQAQTQIMVNTIEPWKTYAACIDVTLKINEEKAGDCVIVLGAFPSCPNQRSVPRADGDVSIIVHTDALCDCGTVPLNFPSYTVVSADATPDLIAHELGHAVGKMTDEYLYQQNNTYSIPGKNCFPSENACTSFAGSSGISMQCTKGCSTVDEYRPSTALMHNTLGIGYGDFETCILRNKLARAIGFQEGDAGGHINPACDGAGGKERPKDPPVTGEYFGGRRVD